MSATTRRTRWILLALFQAALATAAPQLQSTPPAEKPDLPAASGEPGLLVQPYLQNVSADQAGLWFETNTDQVATVTIAPGDLKATGPAQRIHGFTATGLAADTEYRYTVSLDGQQAAEGSLKTWPAQLESIKFFAYGDTRSRPDEHKKVADAMAALADGHLFVLHSGDLVADGTKHEQWPTQFFNPAENLLARVPLLPSMGNHEKKSSLFRSYFDLPGEEYYYSYRVGPVHVTVIDNYRDLSFDGDWRATPQGKWLLQDMQAAEAAPWRIALFHTPVYSRGPHGKLDDNGLPKEAPMRFALQELMPLLKQHGYRLTVNGHDHVYERSESDDLVMLTSGGGGAPTYNVGPESQNPFSKVFVSTTHFIDLEADAETLTYRAIDATGQVIDEQTLHRK